MPTVAGSGTALMTSKPLIRNPMLLSASPKYTPNACAVPVKNCEKVAVEVSSSERLLEASVAGVYWYQPCVVPVTAYGETVPVLPREYPPVFMSSV